MPNSEMTIGRAYPAVSPQPLYVSVTKPVSRPTSVRESVVERNICEFAEQHGWFQAKVEKCNRRGFPDRLFIRNGVVVFIEIKRPGEAPTRQQLRRHAEMRSHGAKVHWVDNLEVAKGILR